MATRAAKGKATAEGIQVVCRNGKAARHYEIEERIEAGVVLTGSEVKSLRGGRADLEGAYASLERGELVLHKMHVGAYEKAGVFGHELRRSRKLLLHRQEIQKIHGRLTMRGYTLIPVELYFKNGWAKVLLGLGKRREVGDRREELRRDADMREAQRHAPRPRR